MPTTVLANKDGLQKGETCEENNGRWIVTTQRGVLSKAIEKCLRVNHISRLFEDVEIKEAMRTQRIPIVNEMLIQKMSKNVAKIEPYFVVDSQTTTMVERAILFFTECFVLSATTEKQAKRLLLICEESSNPGMAWCFVRYCSCILIKCLKDMIVAGSDVGWGYSLYSEALINYVVFGHALKMVEPLLKEFIHIDLSTLSQLKCQPTVGTLCESFKLTKYGEVCIGKLDYHTIRTAPAGEWIEHVNSVLESEILVCLQNALVATLRRHRRLLEPVPHDSATDIIRENNNENITFDKLGKTSESGEEWRDAFFSKEYAPSHFNVGEARDVINGIDKLFQATYSDILIRCLSHHDPPSFDATSVGEIANEEGKNNQGLLLLHCILPQLKKVVNENGLDVKSAEFDVHRDIIHWMFSLSEKCKNEKFDDTLCETLRQVLEGLNDNVRFQSSMMSVSGRLSELRNRESRKKRREASPTLNSKEWQGGENGTVRVGMKGENSLIKKTPKNEKKVSPLTSNNDRSMRATRFKASKQQGPKYIHHGKRRSNSSQRGGNAQKRGKK